MHDAMARRKMCELAGGYKRLAGRSDRCRATTKVRQLLATRDRQHNGGNLELVEPQNQPDSRGDDEHERAEQQI
jgi:hypothetical protein